MVEDSPLEAVGALHLHAPPCPTMAIGGWCVCMNLPGEPYYSKARGPG